MLYPSRSDLRGLARANRTRELTKSALSGNLAPFPPRPPFRHLQRQARVLHERHCQGLELDGTSVDVVGRVSLAEVDRRGVSEEAISVFRVGWICTRGAYPQCRSPVQILRPWGFALCLMMPREREKCMSVNASGGESSAPAPFPHPSEASFTPSTAMHVCLQHSHARLRPL